MNKKDDFIVSFMMTLEEYQEAKREYFISYCKDFNISEEEKNNFLLKMDIFDRAEQHELYNTMQCFHALNDFDYQINKIKASNASIQRQINEYNEKELLKQSKKNIRLANWLRIKNFISKLFKKS